MTIRQLVCLPLFAVLVAPVPVVADEASVRKSLEVEYSRYEAAVLKGMKGLHAWCAEKLAPDYEIHTPDGQKTTRKDFMAVLKSMVEKPDPALKGIQGQKVTIKGLELQGDEAVATVDTRATFRIKDTQGQYGPRGKERQLTEMQSFKETWVNTAGTWKCRKSVLLTSQTLVDGKPIAAPKK